MSDNEHGPDVEAGTEAATQEFDHTLRAEKLKTRVVPTGARKIQFYGDHTSASVPTNLPYSPVKTT
ncbi:hypothetical protein KY284_033208 [Solanum tuberosum]|nr:hypothetical protein KY284_033208 [Solanum tuberosum]